MKRLKNSPLKNVDLSLRRAAGTGRLSKDSKLLGAAHDNSQANLSTSRLFSIMHLDRSRVTCIPLDSEMSSFCRKSQLVAALFLVGAAPPEIGRNSTIGFGSAVHVCLTLVSSLLDICFLSYFIGLESIRGLG